MLRLIISYWCIHAENMLHRCGCTYSFRLQPAGECRSALGGGLCCSVGFSAAMIDGGSASDSDDFLFPVSEDETDDHLPHDEHELEAPSRSRRVSNSSLWGAVEDFATPVNSASSSSPSVDPHVNFFQNGISMKRLFEDIMVDTSSGSGLASSSSQSSCQKHLSRASKIGTPTRFSLPWWSLPVRAGRSLSISIRRWWVRP